MKSEKYSSTLDHSNPQRVPIKRSFAAACVLIALTGCADRRIGTTDPATTDPPFRAPAAAEYYFNPNNDYYNQLQRVKDSVRDNTALKNIEKLLATPIAQWLIGDRMEVESLIRENLEGSRASGRLPVFAAYNIPARDLGSEAKGGLTSPE